MTAGTMVQLSLWLPVPGVWESVLWSGFYYRYRYSGEASTIATVAWDCYW